MVKIEYEGLMPHYYLTDDMEIYNARTKRIMRSPTPNVEMIDGRIRRIPREHLYGMDYLLSQIPLHDGESVRPFVNGRYACTD